MITLPDLLDLVIKIELVVGLGLLIIILKYKLHKLKKENKNKIIDK